jgi:hypothetical protein
MTFLQAVLFALHKLGNEETTAVSYQPTFQTLVKAAKGVDIACKFGYSLYMSRCQKLRLTYLHALDFAHAFTVYIFLAACDYTQGHLTNASIIKETGFELFEYD